MLQQTSQEDKEDHRTAQHEQKQAKLCQVFSMNAMITLYAVSTCR